MVRRIVMVLFFMAAAAPPLAGQGQAFADVPLSQQADPCPPECTIDTMEIVTWYPSPWNSYEELYTMKLGVGDVTTGDGESHLRPKNVGSIKVERSVIFKPQEGDPVPEKDLYTGEYTNVETGEMIYNSSEDKFKYFNGQTWVPQTGSNSGSGLVVYTYCAWDNSWSCTPPACSTLSTNNNAWSWVDLGVVGSEPLSMVCSGGANSSPPSCYGRLVVGRSSRACLKQQ